MIVLGIDPGGRWTGYAVIETGSSSRPPELVESRTIIRPDRGDLMADVPREHLRDLLEVGLVMATEYAVDLVAVEGVTKPGGHATGRAGHIINPGPILATGIVYGALAGHPWESDPTACPFVRIAPGRNGHLLPLTAYPGKLATTSKGGDKLRHERSAYDVAMMGPQAHAIDRRSPR